MGPKLRYKSFNGSQGISQSAKSCRSSCDCTPDKRCNNRIRKCVPCDKVSKFSNISNAKIGIEGRYSNLTNTEIEDICSQENTDMMTGNLNFTAYSTCVADYRSIRGEQRWEGAKQFAESAMDLFNRLLGKPPKQTITGPPPPPAEPGTPWGLILGGIALLAVLIFFVSKMGGAKAVPA